LVFAHDIFRTKGVLHVGKAVRAIMAAHAGANGLAMIEGPIGGHFAGVGGHCTRWSRVAAFTGVGCVQMRTGFCRSGQASKDELVALCMAGHAIGCGTFSGVIHLGARPFGGHNVAVSASVAGWNMRRGRVALAKSSALRRVMFAGVAGKAIVLIKS